METTDEFWVYIFTSDILNIQILSLNFFSDTLNDGETAADSVDHKLFSAHFYA